MECTKTNTSKAWQYFNKKTSLNDCLFQNKIRYLSNYLSVMNIFFKALNDPTRREILELLNKGDLTAGEIADRFDMTKPSISHHLDLLKQAGLVVSVREGQYIKYSINTTVFDGVVMWLMQFKK